MTIRELATILWEAPIADYLKAHLCSIPGEFLPVGASIPDGRFAAPRARTPAALSPETRFRNPSHLREDRFKAGPPDLTVGRRDHHDVEPAGSGQGDDTVGAGVEGDL
jgi:hypothetical protein